MSNHWHAEGRVKTCIMCGQKHPLAEFYSYGYTTNQGKRSTRYESRCKPCARKRRLEAYHANRDAETERIRKWREDNVDYVKGYSKNYRESDHGKRLKAKAQRLRKARSRAGAGDNAEIRAIYEQAMVLEQTIACCPVFDDPVLGKKIHVDHILPLSKGGKHVVENLQLLPIGINMRKGAKCPK